MEIDPVHPVTRAAGHPGAYKMTVARPRTLDGSRIGWTRLCSGPKDTPTARPVTDTITVRYPNNGHYQRSDFSPHKTYTGMSYADGGFYVWRGNAFLMAGSEVYSCKRTQLPTGVAAPPATQSRVRCDACGRGSANFLKLRALQATSRSDCTSGDCVAAGPSRTQHYQHHLVAT
eukprot:COSAG02_NODE_11891_length_1634_cov_2.340717_2_plen_174_part_00